MTPEQAQRLGALHVRRMFHRRSQHPAGPCGGYPGRCGMRRLRGQVAKALEWAMLRAMPADVRAICAEVMRLGQRAYIEGQRPPAPKLNTDWNKVPSD